ncbi:glycoside hydrolase family 3 N-terminal domain-containing protein [Phytoactinopolyspora mesophila]|uniref:Beta-glucosidase n=1 Tax=Phytoactinopolyspora mesophila TaxID=2650750 RepID=A0A7K3M6Q0_9ACTN|nr:glycoside hydrolase family 3 N-terminal domain-containing protein [Phytoactinopolyspora mesophila]NDL58994.1 beta-glucosidase [Phytoactinopolyspora mesophila]
MSVDDLLARMSLREKVGQLNQRLFGWQCVEKRSGRWRLTATFHTELERWDGLGALYGLFRADPWSGRSWADGIHPDERAEVAELVVGAVRRGSTRGIAPLIVEEAPHGHQALGGTILPVPLNLAATWDPDLVEEASAAVAAELASSGVDIALVSALDVLRDPRWGRCEECLGESPLLAARMAEAIVRGMQGPQRARLGADGVGVVLKHFAAQGEAIGGRNGQSAAIGPRELREIHLPPAEAGVRAGAVGIMAAYNDIDGVPCCANPGLLRDLLRDEWGFDGLVMADGHAIDRLEEVAGSARAAARLALFGGVDLSLWDEAYTLLDEIAAADAGVRDAIDQACRRVLHVKQLLGLLPRAAAPASATRGRERLTALRARTRECSAALARQSLVLLDDADGLLPIDLARPRRVLVIGPHAGEATALLGDYVPPLPAGEARSVVDALRDRLPPTTRLDAIPTPRSGLAAIAAEADLVIAVLGGTSHREYSDAFTNVGAADLTADSGRARATSGEGVDLADLRLPGDQDELLAQVRAATTAPIVAVVVAGRPHVLTGVLDNADATVWAGYPGPYGADAVIDALTAERPIPGRLPMTLPAAGGAVPVRHDDRHPPGAVYTDSPDPVLRPFGHGGRAPAAVTIGTAVTEEAPAGNTGPPVHLRVRLENAGAEDAADVLQVFAYRRDGLVVPRRRELVGFKRVRIPANTAHTVEVPVPVADRYILRVAEAEACIS